MKEFDHLLSVLDRLLGADGCPWDQKQTLSTLRESVLEETCELIEAVNLDDTSHIVEELGDLLFNVTFFCKIGEKENRFTTQDVVEGIVEKLIRRHPHVFADAKINGMEEFWSQWNRIKSQEKGKDTRESALDGIPVNLPALARAHKVLKKMHKSGYSTEHGTPENELSNETLVGKKLLDLVLEIQKIDGNVDPEQALRKVLTSEEESFRKWEISKKDQEKV